MRLPSLHINYKLGYIKSQEKYSNFGIFLKTTINHGKIFEVKNYDLYE